MFISRLGSLFWSVPLLHTLRYLHDSLLRYLDTSTYLLLTLFCYVWQSGPWSTESLDPRFVNHHQTLPRLGNQPVQVQ